MLQAVNMLRFGKRHPSKGHICCWLPTSHVPGFRSKHLIYVCVCVCAGVSVCSVNVGEGSHYTIWLSTVRQNRKTGTHSRVAAQCFGSTFLRLYMWQSSLYSDYEFSSVYSHYRVYPSRFRAQCKVHSNPLQGMHTGARYFNIEWTPTVFNKHLTF